MSQNGIDKNIDEEVLIDGKKYRFQGTVDFTNLTIQRIDGDGPPQPDPEPAPGPAPSPQPQQEPPTEGFIKPGGWGADLNNKDAWKVVPMRDNPNQFKVVDGKGKNVATNFKTREVAENFIAYFKKNPFPPQPTPGPGPNPQPGPAPAPTPGTGVDKYGVKLLLADGSQIDYNVEKDTRGSKKDGIRWNWKLDGAKQSEATGYFRFTKDPVDDEVSVKWSEKSHSGSNDVQCYDSGVGIRSGKARIRFENPHPSYTKELGGTNTGGIPLGTKWIGYKGIKRVNADGSVTIELYQDQGDNEGDKPANAWKKIFEYTDTKYKRTGAHPFITIRVDDPDKKGQKNLQEKWLSAAIVK